MKVKELIAVLKRFGPEAEVHLSVTSSDRVIETHDRLWVGDYGSGPQINAALNFRGSCVYVGFSLKQLVGRVPDERIDLGHYDSEEDAAKVHDFYVVHKELDEPLNFPDFDYDNWIPPRTSSGKYNQYIAKILEEKLMSD